MATTPFFPNTRTALPTGLKKPPVDPGVALDPGLRVSDVNFADVIAGLRKPIDPLKGTAGRRTFERGLDFLTPKEGIDPELQSVLDTINAQTGEAAKAGASMQQALATRRGIEGSTIEGANVAEAVGEAQRTGRDLSTQVLLESARERLSGRRAAGEALIGRSQLEAQTESQFQTLAQTLNADQQRQLASLTSDELASVRNLITGQQDRELQKYLGERGIDVSMENINASKQLAREQAEREEGGAFGTLIGAGLGSIGGAGGSAVGSIIGKTIGGGFLPF